MRRNGLSGEPEQAMAARIERREFLGQLSGLGMLGASVFPFQRSRGVEVVADDHRRANNTSLYWAWWGWEPWEHNRRAGGITGAVDGSSRWLHPWYDRLHREELVVLMAKAGVNLVVTHFFKGFGLKHEQAEQQRTAQLVRLAHQHGVQVLGYCQFRSLYYETFLLEEPGAETWIQRDPEGKPITWGRHYFRWTPCIHSPEFRAYLKRVVRFGLEETGLDGFNFDNCLSEPCYCPRCEKMFREWLVTRYPAPRDLFGLGTLAGVRQPPAPASNARVEDPLTRAWLCWRCESLAGFVEEITGFTRSLRPESILMANPSYPVSAGSVRRSVWPAGVGRHLDLMIAENSASPERKGDQLISQIRAYRHGIAVGYRAVSTTWAGGLGREASAEASSALPQAPHTVQLQIAEAAANRGVPGANWALRPLGGGDRVRIDQAELREALTAYLQFVRKHEALWLTATPISDVAVLRTFASGAYDPQSAWDFAATAEEILIRGGFAWGAAFDDRLEVLDGASVLMLAGQTFLAPQTCAAIQAFADRGGGVVILGEVARWDGDGMLYEPSPLDGLQGPRVIRMAIDSPKNDPRAGHAVCLPLPKQWAAVAAAIQQAAGERLIARLSGSTWVAMSAFRTSDERLAVHLVNYAAPQAAGPLQVELGAVWTKRSSARWLTPGGTDRPAIITRREGHTRVEIPSLDIYGILVVE